MTPLFLAAADPVAHVTDKPIIQGQAFGMEVWWISNVTIMLVLGAIVTALIVIPAARRIRTGQQRTLDDFRAQGLWANLVESVSVYMRDEVFRSVLGEQTDRFAPMLWTFFWFILVCNVMGLLPILDATAMLGWNHGHGIGGTATQSIWVTGALAVLAFLFYNVTAFIKSPGGFLKHMTGGAPFFMWPIMVPVELLGTLIKPFALAIRLFANMTGGHLVIAVLLSFVPAVLGAMGGLLGGPIAAISVLGAVGINLLEVLVAFLQAFIFTFLTTLFLGQLVAHEHEEHEEGHGAGHEPKIDDIDPNAVYAAEAVPIQKSHVGGSH